METFLEWIEEELQSRGWRPADLAKEAGLTRGLGILTIAGGGFWIYLAKPRYYVNIGSASGETRALWSTNQQYIQNIANAMNQAIISRG